MSTNNQAGIDVIFEFASGQYSMRIEPEAAKAAIKLLRRFVVSELSTDAAEDAAAEARDLALTRLRKTRLDKRMTQHEVASAIKVRQSHLSAMETGRRSISVDMAKRLADVLDMDWKQLVTASRL